MYFGNVVFKRKIKLVQLADIIINDMNITRNDNVMVYTSLRNINLIDSQPEDLIYLLKMIIGTGGMLLMPAFEENPDKTNQSVVHKDIQSSHYQNNLIHELFGQSLDTYKKYLAAEPVSAWGKLAKFIAEDDNKKENVLDKNSLFYKLFILKAKIIGLGVPLQDFSFLETISNTFEKYSPDSKSETIRKEIIDSEEGINIVSNPFRVSDNKKSYFEDNIYKHFEKDELRAFIKSGIPFFWANAEKVYNKAILLANS